MTVDCLIVGGGVIGLSIAYELAHAGLGVELLDRGTPGREASWAGAGILPPADFQTAEHPLEQLAGLSCRLHPQWARQLRQETGLDTGYRQCGGIYLARSAGEAACLKALAADYDQRQIEMRPLTTAAVARQEPGLADAVAAGRIQAAYLVPSESQLRNPRHVAALWRACRLRGVRIREGVEVVGFERRGPRLEAALTSAGPIAAGNICIAGGAWTHRLLSELDIAAGVLPVRGQMLLYRCPDPPLRHVVNDGSRYLVPRDDGRVLVGSSEEEVGFDKSTTSDVLKQLAQFAQSLVPRLEPDRIEQSWAGLRPATYDGLPYLGRLPGIRNGYVAAGHFRAGLQLSCATAAVMGCLIRGLDPPMDLGAFGIGRGG